MGSKIKSRTISSAADNRIRLINSNFARLWSSDIGTNWTTIRIGCRITIEDLGSALGSTPRLAFGICSGTSNIFMDATTTHWMGAISNAATWTRGAGPPAQVDISGYTGAGVEVMNVAKRIGSTLTVGTSFGSHQWIVYDCTTANRGVFLLDITKGSPNFTTRIMFNNGGGATDISLTTFLLQIPVSVPTFTNHIQSNNSPTIAIDEATNGYFNAVNVGWDRTTPPFELSDIAVVKLA